jgi:hypothetical protein
MACNGVGQKLEIGLLDIKGGQGWQLMVAGEVTGMMVCSSAST